MKRDSIAAALVLLTGLALAPLAIAQQTPEPERNPWNGCCGAKRWSMGPGVMGREG